MMKRQAILIALFLLGNTALHAQGGISCVSFTQAESAKNRDLWTPFMRFISRPLGLESLTEKEREREMNRWSSVDRMRRFMSLQQDESVRKLSSYSVDANEMSAYRVSPYTFEESEAPTAEAPFHAVGQLFVITAAESSCTAFFVEDRSIIMTAAHCVFERIPGGGGDFYKSINFSRASSARHSGETFLIDRIGVVNEWITSSTPHDYDYAFLHVTTPLAAPVNPLTFATTFASDWIAIGYPLRRSDGLTMMFAPGGGDASGAMLLMEGNPMTHGSSGGPWLPPAYPTLNDPFGTEVLSIASIIGAQPNTLLGPILDTRMRDLFEFVKRGCTDAQCCGSP
jgi:hypothetical protein